MRPAPVSHRTVPSGQIDRFWIEKSSPGFLACSSVSTHRRPIVGMNALDERLEGPAERAGLQAVLRLEGRGPAEHAGGVVHVPDPDVRALQREPHALFRRAHRLHRLLPLGDVGAGAERADDVSVVVAQHRVAPFDQPFLARPGENGVLDDRKVAAVKRRAASACCRPASGPGGTSRSSRVRATPARSIPGGRSPCG